ncbi:hypothetical protein TURU_000395 [Turdus rufiventris]|nr:hypothetical protein TURU_000395 [Turdus rufiventris]
MDNGHKFMDLVAKGLVQRCVIIQRDQHGFGFTVSGDRVVLVQSVRPGEDTAGHSWTGGGQGVDRGWTGWTQLDMGLDTRLDMVGT